MKISIVVSNSLKKDPRVIKQIKVALSNGHQVQFVGCMDANYDKAFLDALGCRYDIADPGDKYMGKMRTYTKKIKRRYYRVKLIERYICEFAPDVIHANDFDMLGPAWAAAKKCGAGLVYDSHEVFAENLGIVEDVLLRNYVRLSERRLVHKVDQMISVSNAAADYFRDKYQIDRPVVITNCPMKSEVPFKEKAADAFEVVFHGVMTRGRGYEEFVLSAKHLPKGVRLVLRGYGSLEAELRDLIEKEGLSEKVRFDPPVEVAEVIAAASSSHAGAVLTRPINLNFNLSVSNKLFEYVQAGLPVILSDVPEHRYLNDKYHFGVIIDQVTPECIARAILSLYENPSECEALAANAKRMSEEMTWENESQKLLEIYQNVYEKRNQSHGKK